MVRPSTATNTLKRRAPGRAPQRAHRPILGLACAVDQLMRADADLAAADPPFEPGPHGLADVRRASRGRAPWRAAASTIAAATTWCEACSSEPASRSTSSGLSPGAVSMAISRAPPTVSVPVLSNMTVCVRASASSGPPPLMRMPRRAACDDAGDEGDRRRQDERARRRRDQHREAADRIARQEPGRAGDDQRDGQQQQRVAVGQADERRLGGLRGGHQPHDARIGAFAGRRGGAHLESLAGVERAAARRLAFPAVDRDRLAGQRRLVEHGARAGDDAVDRDDFAGAHQDRVADRDLLRSATSSIARSPCGDARPAARDRPVT